MRIFKLNIDWSSFFRRVSRQRQKENKLNRCLLLILFRQNRSGISKHCYEKTFISFDPGLFFYLNTLEAQQLFTNTNVQNAYKKQTRTSTGKPGKNYWQNSADYKIDVHFNPADQLLTGNETITYFNNSPDTLNQIIIRLYPDLYKKGVQRARAIAEKDLNEGVQIEISK